MLFCVRPVTPCTNIFMIWQTLLSPLSTIRLLEPLSVIYGSADCVISDGISFTNWTLNRMATGCRRQLQLYLVRICFLHNCSGVHSLLTTGQHLSQENGVSLIRWHAIIPSIMMAISMMHICITSPGLGGVDSVFINAVTGCNTLTGDDCVKKIFMFSASKFLKIETTSIYRSYKFCKIVNGIN